MEWSVACTPSRPQGTAHVNDFKLREAMRVYNHVERTQDAMLGRIDKCQHCYYGECERCVNLDECPCIHWWTRRKRAAEQEAKARRNWNPAFSMRQEREYQARINLLTTPESA